MADTVLGKVSCVPRGDYDAGTAYTALDIVGYSGGSYMALRDVQGVTPGNDGTNWMQLAGPGTPGAQGERGEPGAAAGFGTATVTVDDSTGTPAASVELSGPDTAKVFAFAFSGLKGETGAEGEQGPQGNPGTSVKSIRRTSGTGAAGTTDTYTMYDSEDAPIGTFTVYNGSNGEGSGDFMANGTVPMTGNLSMGGNRVTGLGAPQKASDAVRQQDLEVLSDELDAVIAGTTPIAIPVATEAKAGAVKPGSGLEVTADGTLNVTATAQDLGAMPEVSGGTTGQVLTKTTDGQAWQDAPDGLPEGGTTGQILTKTESGAAWADAPETGVVNFNGRTGAVTPQAGDYTADMIGARPDTWTPTADEVGAVPTTRTVNGKPLSEDIALNAADVGARAASWMPTAAEVGADVAGAAEAALTSAKLYTNESAGRESRTTLKANSWMGSSAPWTITLSNSDITTTTYQDILPDITITAEQLEAMQSANIQDGGQTAGNMTLKAYGDKPTIDIPVRLIVRGH